MRGEAKRSETRRGEALGELRREAGGEAMDVVDSGGFSWILMDSDGFWWILADSDVCRRILMDSDGI